MASRSFSTAAATLSFVIFVFCAVSSKATDVVWKTTDGGTIHDGGRAIVADKCSSHADFESGPLPLDKADTEGDDSDVFISFEVETLNFPAKVGIKSGYQTYLFDLDGCKSGNSRITKADCNFMMKHGQIIFSFSPSSGQFKFVVTHDGSKVGPGSYFGEILLHTLRASSHSYTFIAELAKGTKLKNFLVETREDGFRNHHLAKGAKQAFAGDGDDGFCPKSSAACGGSCFGVCERCGPPRYCMCYPNGYTDEDGVKHVRPDCVKYGGDGTRVPEDDNAHKASVENLAAKYKILQTNARNWKRLYGRHGWRPHAAEFGYTPDLIDLTEMIMQMEEQSDL